MSIQHIDNFETDTMEEFQDSQEPSVEASPSTKLERRRRIEDLFEEKKLREELGDFDLM